MLLHVLRSYLEPPPVEHAVSPDPDPVILCVPVPIPADPGEPNPDHVGFRGVHPDPPGHEPDEDIFCDALPVPSQSGSNSSSKQFDPGGLHITDFHNANDVSKGQIVHKLKKSTEADLGQAYINIVLKKGVCAYLSKRESHWVIDCSVPFSTMLY